MLWGVWLFDKAQDIQLNSPIPQAIWTEKQLQIVADVEIPSDLLYLQEYFSQLDNLNLAAIANLLPQLHGGVALAVFDQAKQKLYLFRDYFSRCPLYYSCSEIGFAFASAPVTAADSVNLPLTPHPVAARLFLRLGFIPAPYTPWQECWQVPPATAIVVSLQPESRQNQSKSAVISDTYAYKSATGWTDQLLPQNHPLQYIAPWSAVSLQTLTNLHLPIAQDDHLEQRLIAAIKERLSLAEDRVLSIFLSGGIDSSLILALANSLNHKLQAVTIGFTSPQFDEVQYATKITDYLAVDHKIKIADADTLLSQIQQWLPQLTLPAGDYSFIATALACQSASENSCLALGGDGGDEIFAGYNRHQPLLTNQKRNFFTRLAGYGLRFFPRWFWDNLAKRHLLPYSNLIIKRAGSNWSDKLADLLTAPTAEAAYWQLCQPGRAIQLQPPYPDWWIPEVAVQQFSHALFSSGQVLTATLLSDRFGYLPDDGVVKLSLAVETCKNFQVSSPFLDGLVLSCASSSPGKLILRQILSKYVPAELWTRPKQGFQPPLADWLRESWSEWVNTTLEKTREIDYLANSNISELWSKHLSSKADYSGAIWNMLAWYHTVYKNK